MKVSKAQSAENRRCILNAAARLYREHGLTGVGVADITRDAGLTHGGLYRHFESKDALVSEACAQALADWSIAPLNGRPHAPDDLASRVSSYLTTEHRDHPGQGCPVAALAVDAARAGADLSEVFGQGIERNIARFARVIGGGLPEDAVPSSELQDTALVTLATMVGGLVLARATAAGRPALSDEILTTVRDHLLRAAEMNRTRL